MRFRARTALVGLILLAGCGSGGDGLQEPEIGKARTFELAGFEPSAAVKRGVATTVKLRIEKPEGGTLTTYKRGSGPHTGVHLIFVRKDLSKLIHRHPQVAADGSVAQEIAFPDPGPWHVLVDAYPDLGPNTLQNFQLTGEIEVEGAYDPRPLGTFKPVANVGGDRFALKLPRPLKALQAEYFDVDVTSAAGKPAKFEEYYGATAHAIFFQEETLAYFHTHVCGPEVPSCSGGSQVVGESEAPGRLRVGTLLPAKGTWKLFLQAKSGGRVLTAPFTMAVR